MAVVADAIAAQLAKLLPRGSVWRVEAGSNLYKVLLAAADELARVFQRAEDLLDEAHPPTVDELLAEWEEEFGLPEVCSSGDLTLADRRLLLAAKLAQLGGQDRQYFIDVAAKMGLTITIEEPQPFYVGVWGCTDPVGEIAWKFTWIVHAPPAGEAFFEVATGTVGEPLVSRGSENLGCIFTKIKPAHTEVVVLGDA